jgi:predicted nicotinamide N-methyase
MTPPRELPLPGYSTRQQTLHLGDHDYRIRSLSDRQQFADPDGHAAQLGISSAQWCLFGQVWPAGRLLAETMARHDITGKRILEIGCGLGLASLVLIRRGARIVATDIHPLAEPFLAYNAAQNSLPAVPYRHLCWDKPLPQLGHFDLIIGSDILYERNHVELLAALIQRHAHPAAEVLITDPGRGSSNTFTRALALHGFEVNEERGRMDANDVPPYRGRLLRYHRESAVEMIVGAT